MFLKQCCFFPAFLAFILHLSGPVLTLNERLTHRKLNHSIQQPTNLSYFFAAGRRIADGIIEKGSVAVGTISELGEPEETGKRFVKLSVEEWLWGKPVTRTATLQIKYVQGPSVARGSGPWDAWKNVRLVVGQKLLVAVRSASSEGEQPSDTLVCVVAASDETAMKYLREVVSIHQQCVADPAKMAGFAELISSSDNAAIAGYFVEYLRRKFDDTNFDPEVTALLNLLHHQEYRRMSAPFISRALGSRLMRWTAIAPEAVRRGINSLLEDGSGTDLLLAKEALYILIPLAERDHPLLTDALTDTVREKLRRNYERLSAPERPEHFQAGFQKLVNLSKLQGK